MLKKKTLAFLIAAAVFALVFGLLALRLAGAKPTAPGAKPAAPGSAGPRPGGGASSAGSGSPAGGRPGESGRGDPGQARPGFSVRAAFVERITLQDYLQVNGDVQAETKVDVYGGIGGRIVGLSVELGSRVAKGQLIAEIDPSRPGEEYALNQVFSPITGTVTAVNVSVGSTVGTSTPLATVGIVDRLAVIARVSERDVGNLAVGQAASATLAAFPGASFPLRVARLSPVVDPSSRSKEVKLAFEKPDARVNPGMFAKLVIYTERLADRIVVPELAVIERNKRKLVFVVKDDAKVEEREISVGKTIDGATIVASGLAVGEKVVVTGQQVLADGADVIVVNAKDLAGGSEK